MTKINLDEEIKIFKKDVEMRRNEKEIVFCLYPCTKRDLIKAILPDLRKIEKEQKGKKSIYHSYWFLDYLEKLVNDD